VTTCAECKNCKHSNGRRQQRLARPGRVHASHHAAWAGRQHQTGCHNEWNNVSFIDACVVVRLCHQSRISRRSLTVRNVRGASSHRVYQTDLQHLLSLVGKTSSNLSTTHSTFLIHELTSVNWHLTGHRRWVKFKPGLTVNWWWCNPFLPKLSLNLDLTLVKI